MNDVADSPRKTDSFGPNAWLVDEMYDQFVKDPSSVSESWQEFFEDYRSDTDVTPVAPGQVPARHRPHRRHRQRPRGEEGRAGSGGEGRIEARRDSGAKAAPAAPKPIATADGKELPKEKPAAKVEPEGEPLRGAAARIVSQHGEEPRGPDGHQLP